MVYAIFVVVVLLVSSGDPGWLGGWLYLAAILAGELVTAWALALADPELLRERSAAATLEDVAPWDRALAPLTAFSPLAIVLVAGLAMRWNRVPSFGMTAVAVGVVLLAVGLGLGLWAMSVNPFYSPVVRIRPRHGHVVVSDGPYRFLRHPGSLGAILRDLAPPLILGSPWALVPAALVVGLDCLRTALEDRDLRTELPGYAAYAARVRWGLVPRMW